MSQLVSKQMKFTFPFFISFLLLLFSGLIDGRKDMGDYWKSIMKGQPMPEAIKGFIHQDPASFSSKARKMDHFVRDFDARPNSIIYHGHVERKGEKPLGVEMKPELKKEKFFVEPVNLRVNFHKHGHDQKEYNN
ncbi:hypothetical protein CK203_010690 [Vitis vinifera]|uniref:Organ-specific protein S2 n=1 Tax=Vitis vinifera TaxID=29760 RepID=A0A438JTR1_VITVI|nr:hypothetical protein CK203_010690 [Vitis vinifera]